MPIHFLSPNPEQKEALDELEKLLEVLDKKPSKNLMRNTRFIRKFTRGMLIAGKRYSGTATKFRGQYQQIERVRPRVMHEKPQIPLQKISPVPPSPPPPMPIIAGIAGQGINIKGLAIKN